MRHTWKRSHEGLDYIDVWSEATKSLTSINNTTIKRTMDSKNKCYDTVEADFPCVYQIVHQMKVLLIECYVSLRENSEYKY